MAIPLTTKTLLTQRIIRGLTYFLFRFISIVHFNEFIPLKIPRFNIVFTYCPFVVVPKKVSKDLSKICNLCRKFLKILARYAISVEERSSSNPLPSTNLRAIDLDLFVLGRSSS